MLFYCCFVEDFLGLRLLRRSPVDPERRFPEPVLRPHPDAELEEQVAAVRGYRVDCVVLPRRDSWADDILPTNCDELVTWPFHPPPPPPSYCLADT